MEIEDMLRDLDIKEDEKTFEYKEKILKFQNEEKALHEINKISIEKMYESESSLE